MPRHPLAGLAILLLFAACDKPTTPTRSADDDGSGAAAAGVDESAAADEASAVGVPFPDAQLFFEFNATDNDLGVQLFLDAPGWKRVRVFDPGRDTIAVFIASGRLGKLGITELRFESEEPAPEEVLALFPEGRYQFRGRTVEGQHLASDVELSHELAPPPTFTPADGDEVDRDDAIVQWNAPGAESVEIIIESDEVDGTFDVVLPADAHRLRVPRQYLVPGVEYKIEILSINESGNRTLVEHTFGVRE